MFAGYSWSQIRKGSKLEFIKRSVLMQEICNQLQAANRLLDLILTYQSDNRTTEY